MTNKYVIKNCPAYNNDADFSCRNEAIEPLLCQDCTDCVMKQIYFKCEEAYAYGGKGLCSKIIKMLEIEECESENTQN